jgi:hypothetical protein
MVEAGGLPRPSLRQHTSVSPWFAGARLQQGIHLLSLQPAHLAEAGEGTARACSVLLALPTIRLGKNTACPRVATAKIPAARLKSS